MTNLLHPEPLPATAALCDFVAGLGLDDVPPEVLHQATRCLIDWLGVTLDGASDPGVDMFLDVSEEAGGAGTATVIGRDRTTSVLFAALINGYSAHVEDYDDTYNPGATTVHGSAPVWPVIAALAETRTTTGAEALLAFVAGFETQVRVARAAGPSHYDRGWHVTGTVGHLGAAAAASRLLRLPASVTANALGTAGTQAAGLKEVYGSMGKALHPGKAASDGLLSALLAQRGFTSSPTIVEGPRGFLNVLSDDPDPREATEELGSRWTLPDDGFKFYACGSLIHPTIECVLALRAQENLSPDDVVGIEARVHDYVSWVTAKRDLRSGLDGKFSIFHGAAVALVDGRAGLEQFSDARVAADDVAAVRERVTIVADHDMAKDAARVEITTADGRRLVHSVAHNKGTPGNPLTDEEIGEKFLDLAAPVLGDAAARRLLDTCWGVRDVPDFADVVRSCRPGRR